MGGWLKRRAALEYAGGISRKTLARWERLGLRSYRPGGRRKFYKPSDIDRFLERFPVDASEEIDRAVDEILNDLGGK